MSLPCQALERLCSPWGLWMEAEPAGLLPTRPTAESSSKPSGQELASLRGHFHLAVPQTGRRQHGAVAPAGEAVLCAPLFPDPEERLLPEVWALWDFWNPEEAAAGAQTLRPCQACGDPGAAPAPVCIERSDGWKH